MRPSPTLRVPYLLAHISCTTSTPLLDEFLIEVPAIGQKHIGNGTLVHVEAVCVERDFLAEEKFRRSLLGSLAVGLAFLRAICKLPPV